MDRTDVAQPEEFWSSGVLEFWTGTRQQAPSHYLIRAGNDEKVDHSLSSTKQVTAPLQTRDARRKAGELLDRIDLFIRRGAPVRPITTRMEVSVEIIS